MSRMACFCWISPKGVRHSANGVERWRIPPIAINGPGYALGRQGVATDEFIDARFLGADLVVELQTNPSYPGKET
jgi:hypothetical protein